MKKKSDVLDQLKTTPIVQVSCQKTGVSRATYYRWRNEDLDFREKSDLAMKEGVAFINDMAESQLLTLIKEKHPTSVYYWLNHRHPEYSDKRIMLSVEDQTHLLGDISSFKKQDAAYFIIEKMIQGGIPSHVVRSFLPIIQKFSKQLEANKTDGVVDSLREMINMMSKREKEPEEPPKTD